MAATALRAGARDAGPRVSGGARALFLRNLLVARRGWVYFVTGFAEPVFYLLSIGVGVGALVSGFAFRGEQVPYAAFVAPAMLASSAMQGAVLDSTFNVFFKLRYQRVYDAVLATPLGPLDIARGEISWSMARCGVYSTAFLALMAAMGLVSSWWALLTVPAAVLVGAAFGAVGMALTTFMRSWQDFEFITLVTIPLLLFSATFFPIEAYDEPWRQLVELTPLYRAVVLMRELTTGLLTWESVASVAYLVVMGLLGLAVAARRLGKLLLR